MPYFKNQNGVYFTDSTQPVQGGVETTEAEFNAQITLSDYDIAVERHLDAAAKAAGYYDPLGRIPNIDRACSYAGFDNAYQQEGQSFVKWRGAVWEYVYGVRLAVEANKRPTPTIDELLAELPVRN